VSAARDRKANNDLTLQEAADILGVHYMTAYRYVRTGRLVATQVDGAWHVPRSSIERIAAPATPGRTKRGAATSGRRYERGLVDQLVQGDEAQAWQLTQRALASAYSPEDLYLDVLGPALRQVGDDWAAGRVSVAEEHRASAVMQRLIGRLGPLLTRRGRSRGTVVLGAPENDHHSLASALVADVLRGRGFSVTDLGASTPTASFVETVTAADRLVGTGIVVSSPLPDREIAALLKAVKRSSAAPLLLGGVAIRDDDHARAHGADARTDSARDAVDWFDAVSRS
jgi:excisionase family DNA binding protein